MSYPYFSAVSSGLHITARFPGGWNGAGGMVHYSNLALHRQAGLSGAGRTGEADSGALFADGVDQGHGGSGGVAVGGATRRSVRHAMKISELMHHHLDAQLNRAATRALNIDLVLYYSPI